MKENWKFAKALQLVLYIGAARADSDAVGKSDKLLKVVLPTLEPYRYGLWDEDYVMRQVRDVMGDGWEPTGEWKVWIDKLTEDLG